MTLGILTVRWVGVVDAYTQHLYNSLGSEANVVAFHCSSVYLCHNNANANRLEVRVR